MEEENQMEEVEKKPNEEKEMIMFDSLEPSVKKEIVGKLLKRKETKKGMFLYLNDKVMKVTLNLGEEIVSEQSMIEVNKYQGKFEIKKKDIENFNGINEIIHDYIGMKDFIGKDDNGKEITYQNIAIHTISEIKYTFFFSEGNVLGRIIIIINKKGINFEITKIENGEQTLDKSLTIESKKEIIPENLSLVQITANKELDVGIREMNNKGEMIVKFDEIIITNKVDIENKGYTLVLEPRNDLVINNRVKELIKLQKEIKSLEENLEQIEDKTSSEYEEAKLLKDIAVEGFEEEKRMSGLEGYDIPEEDSVEKKPRRPMKEGITYIKEHKKEEIYNRLEWFKKDADIRNRFKEEIYKELYEYYKDKGEKKSYKDIISEINDIDKLIDKKGEQRSTKYEKELIMNILDTIESDKKQTQEQFEIKNVITENMINLEIISDIKIDDLSIVKIIERMPRLLRIEMEIKYNKSLYTHKSK